MAEPALAFLLELVKELVKEYKDVMSGAENEFEQLKNELDQLKGFLNDEAKKYSSEDGLSKKLESQIRDVVYEIEDTIDTCLTKAIEAKARGKAKRISYKFKLTSSSTGFNLAKEVISLRKEKVKPLLDGAKARLAAMQTADRSTPLQDQGTKMKRDKPIRRNRVVGFDDQEAIITGYLMEEKQSLVVIPIIGIPGQGKTTLAWKVYQNDTVRFNFPMLIWINISEKFNSKDVFLQILKKYAPSKDTSNMDYLELVEKVTSCLEQGKFLLVLDDVWSVDAWNEIKEVLPTDNGNGKVIITSRDMKVGTHSAATFKPHKLKFLNESESWTLLQLEVYGNEEDCPNDLRDIGQHLANKCDGVPLTIIVIGGVLVDQLSTPSLSAEVTKKWRTMAENMSNTIEKVQRIKDVVELSYERLPNRLKVCFVYIGVFPEDYEIPVKLLTRLWIAEGFIHPNESQSLEQTAEEYVDDLICRNLLKVDKTNHMGKAKTCRVHDMIRAFCISKSKDEKFCQQIKVNKETGLLEPPVTDVEKLHRLCFQSDLSKFLSENPSGAHVRSFLCFYEQPFELGKNHLTVIPDGFLKLRILESKSVKFPEFPGKVPKLIHLRYLTLHIDNLEKLPKSISQLWNLQVLVVETKLPVITMEGNMWKMILLRHVKTKASIKLESNLDGEAGQNLQTLERLSPESCTEAVYKRAKNLKTLGISGNLANLFGKNFLKELRYLEKLKLVNNVTFEATSDDALHLPQLNCFPPNLKRLTLTKTSLEWQHMSTLAMIKSLEVLKLKDNAFVGLEWNASSYKFPNLQLLVIGNTDLVIWKCSPDSFPGLTVVVLKRCESLIKIPQCVGDRLEKLDIERLCKTAVESARKIYDERKGIPQGKFAVPFVFKQCPVCEKM